MLGLQLEMTLKIIESNLNDSMTLLLFEIPDF